jgi:hypothetical protein
MFSNRSRLTTFVLASIVVLVPRADAQAVAIAQLAGRITDPSGAAVASAQIRAIETGKQQVHTTSSDSDGRYVIPNLPVGAYRLEITAPGFKVYSQTGIVLQVRNN